MSANLRNRRVFKMHTIVAEPVECRSDNNEVCLIAGKPKVKYQSPDDVPQRFTQDGHRLWPYPCDFCGAWHASSHAPKKWRSKESRA